MSRLPFTVQYDILRKRIEHGDGLVNNRLTWWLASQAAIYTAFFSAWSGHVPDRREVMILIATVGIILSCLSIMSVIGHFMNVQVFCAFWNSQLNLTDQEGNSISDFPHLGFQPRWWGSAAHLS